MNRTEIRPVKPTFFEHALRGPTGVSGREIKLLGCTLSERGEND